MNNARANFAALEIKNMLYVYGGVMDSDQHKAKLVEKIIERYNPSEDKWEEIVIDHAPRLFAFGWC